MVSINIKLQMSVINLKGAVSSIFSVTINSQKAYFFQWQSFLDNNPTSAQKQLLIVFGCGWPGWKWIATF